MGPTDTYHTFSFSAPDGGTLYWDAAVLDGLSKPRPVRDEFDAILAVVANTAWGVNHDV